MLPVDCARLPLGYSSEMPATSSAVRGAYNEVARPAASVDIKLAVKVCWRPNACPISCVTVRKKASVKLGDVQLLKLRLSRTCGRRIGTNSPEGPATGALCAAL